ncbi:hypothetical protein [uncultured Dokdonia sp.]|uniref:hypothetical protein n=1 Tax=uncultured Dokdonia sp. TaxID=575653 RepID=UPI00262FB7BA|nr:hypothetical protein [uncultured Dokdonia sp.]
MPAPSKDNLIQRFLKDHKPYTVLAGLLAGLYPMFFYATNNYTLVNTVAHLFYFIAVFLLIPMIGITIAYMLVKKVNAGKWTRYVVPFSGTFSFLFLIQISLFGDISLWASILVFVIAGLVAYFLWKQYKKIMVFQALLAMMGLVTFISKPLESYQYDSSWQESPDDIKEALFVTKPNVYFIQPDGYVNFSELYTGHYKSEDHSFQEYLESAAFSLYPNFRSNYASTLTSNSATFMMKHHYYDMGLSLETFNARNIIVSDNTVLSVFKNNGYKTHLLTELPYLLQNRPEIGYDYCNFTHDDVKFLGKGLGERVDLIAPLKMNLEQTSNMPKFFFIEIFNPGHINNALNSKGIEEERQLWLEGVRVANMRLKETINLIKEKDPKALIVIMADHGGFVGLESTKQMHTKTQDRDLLYSIFSSNLAIHWPDGQKRHEADLKSAVNIFRVLFSYLSADEKYLEHTEDNASYIVIKKEAPKGVYQCIDDAGAITFIKK